MKQKCTLSQCYLCEKSSSFLFYISCGGCEARALSPNAAGLSTPFLSSHLEECLPSWRVSQELGCRDSPLPLLVLLGLWQYGRGRGVRGNGAFAANLEKQMRSRVNLGTKMAVLEGALGGVRSLRLLTVKVWYSRSEELAVQWTFTFCSLGQSLFS